MNEFGEFLSEYDYIHIIRDLLFEIEAAHNGEAKLVNKHILATYDIDLFKLIGLNYDDVKELANLSWEDTYERLGETKDED